MAEVEKIRLDGVDYDIRDASAYKKPSTGIPASDLASAVRTSLGKADTALQSYTETDPTVPSWAKASTKPTYTAVEVGALPSTTSIPSALSDLSDDSTHRVVTDAEKATWNGKYTKPSTGIPASDLAAGVIPTVTPPEVYVAEFGDTSYDAIDDAIFDGKLPICYYNDRQYVLSYNEGQTPAWVFTSITETSNLYYLRCPQYGTQEYDTYPNDYGWNAGSVGLALRSSLNAKENTSNKVTSLSSSSTDTQYPSAKAVYDMIGDVETALAALL